jgi:hypothetical protein
MFGPIAAADGSFYRTAARLAPLIRRVTKTIVDPESSEEVEQEEYEFDDWAEEYVA